MNKYLSSRRSFLQGAAGATAASAFGAAGLRAQPFPKINPALLITPDQAQAWNMFKASCGPTYAGSAGWKRYTDFLLERIQDFGGVDLAHVDIPYDRYVVDDWPDRRTHRYDSGIAVEKLVTDGTPVAVVASYGMTSGATPAEGVTAAMLFYDPASPPSPEQITGKILVCATTPYPAQPYDSAFIDSYTPTDYEWRSPGKWPPLFTPPPTSVMSSYHSRWVFSQLNGFASTAIMGKALALVIVYDLSPAAAFGLAQRSVYTPSGKASLGATYVNCPTLTLDRVNGAKVLTDAKAGKAATLTLTARFERATGRSHLAFLPGKNYGTPADRQVLLATHTDAMSLIEDNGGLGMIGIMSYYNKLPRAQRPRTLAFYFDCRHFMPGGEDSWPQFDYYSLHPEGLKPIVATMGMEHMGGRQTIETGAGGNTYSYSTERPEDGGVITSLIDVNNNNVWLVDAVARAATDNHWPRVDVKAGDIAPGVNGGRQARVRSPMNKGRAYNIPGMGLAGDWPGGWTQTYSQMDTEAGLLGFDRNYFRAQVGGLSQIAGELMQVDPKVIDLGWGELRSAILKLDEKSLRADGARKSLMDRYLAAFRAREAGDAAATQSGLKTLAASLPASVTPEAGQKISTLIDSQSAKSA